MKLKKVLFWVLAVIISMAAMFYQRMTGPTYPKKYEISYQNEEYSFTLPRSNNGRPGDYPVEIQLPDAFSANLVWRLFPTDNSWDTLEMERQGDLLSTSLSHQPPAGKIEYHLELMADDKPIDLLEDENVVIRFRGDVPAWALIPHVLMMILTVIWSMATILFALANMPEYKRYTGITIILLLIGGFILGPIVQKYSFGQLWTGWPLGEDLTDNKVLFALIAFLVAWFLRKKSYGRWLSIGAALVMLAVYLIPHSMNGSELDPESGEVVTGSLLLLLTRFRTGVRIKHHM
ncbi:MAG: hypothetical protein KAR16_07000 [Bacteroidales bacterium]|nr:hypothetical protein [Bacteroidales bacterium]